MMRVFKVLTVAIVVGVLHGVSASAVEPVKISDLDENLVSWVKKGPLYARIPEGELVDELPLIVPTRKLFRIGKAIPAGQQNIAIVDATKKSSLFHQGILDEGTYRLKIVLLDCDASREDCERELIFSMVRPVERELLPGLGRAALPQDILDHKLSRSLAQKEKRLKSEREALMRLVAGTFDYYADPFAKAYDGVRGKKIPAGPVAEVLEYKTDYKDGYVGEDAASAK